MKNILHVIFTLIISFYALPFYSQSVKQKGIVRKITHSKTDVTVPVKGVKVVVNNVASNVSNLKGQFSINIIPDKNQSYKLQDVRIPKKSNYILAYPTISEKQYISKNNLLIALITVDEKKQITNENYKRLFKKYHEQENKLIAERNKLEELQLEYDRTDKEYKKVSVQLDSVKALLEEYFNEDNKSDIREQMHKISEELAMTDYKSLDSIDAEIYDLKKAGKWEVIRNVIIRDRMKGDAGLFLMNRLKDKKNSEKIVAEAKDMALNADVELRRTLKDFETIIETFKMQHLNDSVSKYYKILLEAIPDNWKYLNEAGEFEQEYMFNIDLSLQYHNDALKHAENDTMRYETYNNLGTCYMHNAEYDKAIDYYTKSLNIQKSLYKKDNVDISISYYCLSDVYIKINDYDTGLKYCNKALKIIKQYKKAEPKVYAALYNELGNIYMKQYKYGKALKMYEKTLEIDQKLSNNGNLGVDVIYNNIANVYKEMGKFDIALDYLNKAIEIDTELYGDNHPMLATCYGNVCNIYVTTEEIDEAFNYAEKALKIREAVLRTNHPDLASSYNDMGYLYNLKKDFAKSLQFYNKAVDIKVRIFGEEDLNTAITYNNMGDVYSSMKDYDKAMFYFKKSLEIRKKNLGNNNSSLIYPYCNIGNIYFCLEMYDEAIIYFKKALVLVPDDIGKENNILSTLYENLGTSYNFIGKPDEAMDYLGKATVINEQIYGKNHVNVAYDYISMTNIAIKVGNSVIAKELLKEATEIFKRPEVDGHKNLIETYYNFAGYYAANNKNNEALETFSDLKKYLDETNERDDYAIATCYKNLGIFYSQFVNDKAKGLENFKIAYEMYLKVLGEDNPKTIDLKNMITNLE